MTDALYYGDKTDELVDILANYFARERLCLDERYSWEIPQNIPNDFGLFDRGIDSPARANIRLRRFLRKAWMDKPSQQLNIAKWYVRTWGGIRANKEETIMRYVRLSESDLAALAIEGVATWSKILCVRNPETYPIYDARVCASLSAIQLAKGVKVPIVFPQVPSRNGKIAEFQRLLERRSSDAVIKIKRSVAYGEYVTLLSTVSRKTGLDSPEEVEMVLFANAVNLVDSIQA
jgi:hypothetical protein